ncbi:hypothetical protein Ddye_006043 [Dipteronia dyeriana]|uniref:TOG domain-containing protein n=1 Tax=Dipteronia dyeriana TaxID=168575 RepID=A0AAD9XHL4_9ROSI|nr:hypothetical protein Ddye_006043 [Dipteronia dyeriana]
MKENKHKNSIESVRNLGRKSTASQHSKFYNTVLFQKLVDKSKKEEEKEEEKEKKKRRRKNLKNMRVLRFQLQKRQRIHFLSYFAVSFFNGSQQFQVLPTLFSLAEDLACDCKGRKGIALALSGAANFLRTEDLPIVMTFLISKALADPNTDVQKSVLEAGIKIIDKHRKDNISLLFLLFEDYLNKKDEAPTLVSKLLDKLMKSDKNGERRGAAFGLAGVVKGFGISCLEKYEIVITLKEAFVDRYVSQMLPLLLVSFSDQVFEVRKAAESAARAMMSQLSAQGVKLVLPSLLKGLEDKDWQTKRSSVEMLGIMADHAPQQLSQYLYMIMPKLNKVSTDTHPIVQSAGETAVQQA